MSIYKKFTTSDATIVPFNTNKLFSFTSASATKLSINLETYEYTGSALSTYSSSSTDTLNTIKYHQLDHLYYKNFKTDIATKFGEVDYTNQQRTLYNKVNTLSIPSGLYGLKIKEGTFSYSGSQGLTPNEGGITIIDDKKGNLIVSGTNLISHSIDNREKVFQLGPIKGFKKYDLNSNLYGKTRPDPVYYYSQKEVQDDSYYLNNLEYKHVRFTTGSYKGNISCSAVHFPLANSTIISPHNETYNFNPDDDFTISMYVNPARTDGGYLISKSTTKTAIKTSTLNVLLSTTGSSQLIQTKAKPQYPFEIYIHSASLYFRKSDGINTPTLSVSIVSESFTHMTCMTSASEMSIWVNGFKTVSGSDTTTQTQNQANLYIGSKGDTSNYFTGSLSNIIIFNTPKLDVQIANISESLDGSPYIGNVFYSQGIATCTHPKYTYIFKQNVPSNCFNSVSFKSIHPIFENEYQCTVSPHEYNFTNNISTRKIKSDQKPELANFVTGSNFKPYITTIGLFDENNELLVVGKLGQPTKVSEETDTTFVIKWDS